MTSSRRRKTSQPERKPLRRRLLQRRTSQPVTKPLRRRRAPTEAVLPDAVGAPDAADTATPRKVKNMNRKVRKSKKSSTTKISPKRSLFEAKCLGTLCPKALLLRRLSQLRHLLHRFSREEAARAPAQPARKANPAPTAKLPKPTSPSLRRLKSPPPKPVQPAQQAKPFPSAKPRPEPAIPSLRQRKRPMPSEAGSGTLHLHALHTDPNYVRTISSPRVDLDQIRSISSTMRTRSR